MSCDASKEIQKLAVWESCEHLAEAQQEDESLLNKGYSTHLVENIKVLCKDSKMAISKSLQHRALAWFHHYLQHPGTKRLKETLRLSMYWKGLQTTVQSHIKKCHSCQMNKCRQLKYGKLPTKLAITNPWEALCVDLIGPYTLKGKDKTQIDFMCVTMIDPATSWFEIVELPVSQLQELDIPTGTKGQRSNETHIWPIQSARVTLLTFSQMPHGPFALPITQY
eukprot:CCRYP_000977-RA/>CCRYP_000977-RA protein AED:0.53 eAED:0.57 QI:0/0/0/0.66/0/0/3/0/222